uniref:Reverse transcriptase domain-containing protein n=1 Tax=Tanacetum cinerariifolium TaxID=118510 RepID=A0A6L2MW30_TANCI|nr:hypothetical protein [Tanacetum cinerariifolium]
MVTKDEGNNGVEIIMVNVILPDHMDDVPVVEPNQHNDVPAILEPEEEEPQEEEEDDMEVDIEEDENEPELTYPYEGVDPLNALPPASESEPEDVIGVEDTVEYKDKTVPASHSRMDLIPVNLDRPLDREKHRLPQRVGNRYPQMELADIDSLFGRMTSLSRRLCGRETAHAVVKKKEKAKDEYYGKLILDFGNDVRSSMEEEIRRSKSAPLTQAAVWRMIKESVNAAIAAERARHVNARNDARGSGPVRVKMSHLLFGKKVKFATVILQGHALTWWNSNIATMGLETMNQMPWTKMKQLMTAEFNELALMCPRMVESKRVKVDAYIWGLYENIKDEVTYSKPTNLNEAVCMAHKFMEQKSQARDERILEGKKQKWENFQNRNSSCKSNHKDNSSQSF